jgi:hypothetical protein
MEGEPQMPGMEDANKVSLQGVSGFKVEQEFELGEKVELRISGHVTMTGREILESEGERGVTKIHADIVEVV